MAIGIYLVLNSGWQVDRANRTMGDRREALLQVPGVREQDLGGARAGSPEATDGTLEDASMSVLASYELAKEERVQAATVLAIGLLAFAVGLGAPARQRLHVASARWVQLAAANCRRQPSLECMAFRAALAPWDVLEGFAVSALHLVVIAFVYLLLSRLLSGLQPSPDLLVRTADDTLDLGFTIVRIVQSAASRAQATTGN
jgi:hypothetical protein